jgi:hypothetical protein
MRKPIRSFIREYKGRSPRSIISKEMIESVSDVPGRVGGVDATTRIPQRSTSETAFDAANAIFRASGNDTVADSENAPKTETGRVLPCLRQDIGHSQENTGDEEPKRLRLARGAATKVARPKPVRVNAIHQTKSTAEAPSNIAPTPEVTSAIEEAGREQKSRSLGRKWAQKKELGPGQKWKRRLTIYAR